MTEPSIRVVNRSYKPATGETVVYIGRGGRGMAGSPLANPFKLTDPSDDQQRAIFIDQYRAWLTELLSDPNSPQSKEIARLAVMAKRGAVALQCWCAPKPCHGDVVKDMLDGAVNMDDQKHESPADAGNIDEAEYQKVQANHTAKRIRLALGKDPRETGTPVTNREFTLSALAGLLTQHKSRADKVGPYFCAPMTRSRRKGDNAEPWNLFPLDFDGKEGDRPDTEQSKAFFSDVWHVGYSTHSYTPENGKHRIVLLLNREIDKTEYKALFDAFAEALPFVPDPKLNHPDQPVFLPAHPPGATPIAWRNESGQPLDVDAWLTRYKRTSEAESRAERAYQPSGDGVIAAFNDAHDIVSVLEQHGYRRRGKKYLHPNSESGIASVSILGNGNICCSHSSSDPLGDGKPHDAFDVWTILEHQGDKRKATKAAAELLGMNQQSRAKTQDEGKASSDQMDPIPLGGDPLRDLPTFPLDALPNCIRLAAEEVARFDKVPVESPATIALSMLATAIGKNAIVEERTGLEHYPALFFALIASSGERKSPPFRKMQAPYIRYIEEQAESHQRAVCEAQAGNDTIQHRIKRLLKDAEQADNHIERQDIARQIANLKVELKALPMDPRRFTSDCTEQVLFRLMESHGGQFSIQSGEGRPVFDAILGKYSGEGRTGDGMILAGISGDTITRDRIGSADTGGQESGVILHPCLNVCVMIQPDKYLQVARHPYLRASGALARIWPVWLPSMVGTRLEAEGEAGLNTRAMQGYNELVTGLLATLRDKSHQVTLSSEAAELRREFHNSIESMMLDGEELADVRDIASKATSQAVKLALVLHVVSHPTLIEQDASVIDTDTMSRAIQLGTYFLHQSVSSQRHADEEAQIAPARRILEWMHRTGKKKHSFSEIQQFSPRPRLSAKELIQVMELLVDHHHVVAIDTGAKHPDYQLRDGNGK